MKKMRKYKWILFMVLILCLTLTVLGGSRSKDDQYIHVGIAVYDLDDTFMNSLITALENRIDEAHMKKKISYEICDAKGNSRRQNKQLQYMYTQNYDMMLINLVDPSSAASVLNNAKELDIPVILFNRDIAEKDLKITDNVWYVGTDASQDGQIQGEMLRKIWNEQRNRVDKNKDYFLVLQF
jgi:methyl-galactoside transport system substrate-binding protein